MINKHNHTAAHLGAQWRNKCSIQVSSFNFNNQFNKIKILIRITPKPAYVKSDTSPDDSNISVSSYQTLKPLNQNPGP